MAYRDHRRRKEANEIDTTKVRFRHRIIPARLTSQHNHGADFAAMA